MGHWSLHLILARVAIDMAAYSLNLKDVEVFAPACSTARRASTPRHGKRQHEHH